MSLKRAWILSVVGYSIVRAVAAWGFFGSYGVNPWIFAVIDIGTAVPYASAVARIPAAVSESDLRSLARWAAIALIAFLAPYAYLWVAAPDAPAGVRAGLLVVVVCLLGAVVAGLVRKSRLTQLEV